MPDQHLPRFEIIYTRNEENGGYDAHLIDHDVRRVLIEADPTKADNPFTGVVGWSSGSDLEALKLKATTFLWPHHLDMRKSYNWR